MSTILVRSVINKALIVLQDTGKTRWSDADLLGWLNSAALEIVSLKPNSNVQNASIALVAGVKQTISGISLIRVTRNMGANGAAPGQAIDFISLETLNSVIPDWPLHAANGTVKFYAVDPRDREVFYVYPPQAANTTQQVEAMQSVLPTTLLIADIETDTLPLNDEYETALLHGTLKWAFAEDTDVGDSAKSEMYEKKMFAAIGYKSAAEQTPPAGDTNAR